MDGGNNNGENSEGKGENKSNHKRGKPPDKRRHQMEMNHYTDLIQKKETLFKSLNAPKSKKSASSVNGSRDELLGKLRTLKNEKEQKMKQKQVIDAELKTLNQQVVKKNETCMKLQANVNYKDEQRINNAIKHLERHLSTCRLKLSEEKKLVSEIDALKRSKKTLSEYITAKQDVDQLRQRQSRLRSERNTLIRETHDIRARENDVKVSLDSLKEENKEIDLEEKKPTVDKDTLKKEIDSLYEQQRELHESYKQALVSYQEEQKQIEKDLQLMKAEQRRDKTRLTKITADRARTASHARQEKRLEPKPYEEEKNICVCLIQYLEPLIAQCSSENDEVDAGNKTAPRYLDVPKSESSIPEEGSFVMKKDPDDNLGGLFVQSNRRMTRKGSRKGRKSKDFSQKLVLHPHVFEQFFKLSLEPPSTYADVIGILEKLREKKNFYEKESSKSDQPLSVIPENLASEGARKVEVKHIRSQTTIVVSPLQHANDLSRNEQNPAEHEKEEVEHEIAKAEHKMAKLDHGLGEVQREILMDEHETDQAHHETKQTEHEVEQLQHETEQAEHEVQQLRHEPEEAEHDVGQTQHESEKEEHKMIRTLPEKDQLADENVDNEDMDIFKNERNSCKDEQIATENMLNKAEGNEINELSCNEDTNKDVLNSPCMNCSTIITDALEKGIDSINIKETSQEIQVRVT